MTSDQIRSALEQKSAQLSASINTLRSRLREAKHESRAAWESQLAELERQRRAASQQVAEFRSDSAEAWATFQTGMAATWKRLGKTCQDALGKLKT